MKLALCIVGCGQFARTFVRGLQPVRDDLDLFFASRDGARARAYVAQFQGCGAFGSYEAAAADPRVEALYLCTPPTCIRPTPPWRPRRASTSWWRNPLPAPWPKAGP